jgi:phosphoribosyl-dephospho-CoA transferase
MERMNALRVHDLVQLRDGAWAVVRRARETNGVPVGLRGITRGDRVARVIDASEIVRTVTPEEAVTLAPFRPHPVFTGLALARETARRLDLSIGATGACGYELVTQRPALHDDSDLDIVVRTGFDDPRLAQFAFALRDASVRLDIEVLLDDGCGAALAEVLRGGAFLVKTPDGPALW